MRSQKQFAVMSGMLLSAFMILCHAVFSQVEIGDKAPKFKAPDEQGDTWKLADHLGEEIVVLYFYPAAMTGGCTKQACAYRDNRQMLSALNATVVGISGDEVQNLQWFVEAENLNFPLLSDADGKIARKYGVPVKEGGTITRSIGGEDQSLARSVTTARWTFVIDLDGRIVYRDTSVSAAEDSNNVIEAIKNL